MVESKNCKKKHFHFQEFEDYLFPKSMAINQSFAVYYE